MATEAAHPQQQLGPLLRLWGLTTAQLPEATATADDLAPFIISILQEAVPFIDSAVPKADAGPSKLWKARGTKSSGDSVAKVELLERTVAAAELETVAARHELQHVGGRTAAETWVCRRSVHRDAAIKGTASWAEFRTCLKDRHAETEDAFTPTVVGARAALLWDEAAAAVAPVEEGGVTWGHFTLRVEEMRHRVGRPLRDRTFPVLQLTCAAITAPEATAAAEEGGDGQQQQQEVEEQQPKEFLVVSITVSDFASASPHAELSRAKNVVVAAYASVERVRKLAGWDGDVEWLMATASDARGHLPTWLQALAVPGQIAKDVPLFLAWLARERAGEKHPETVGTPASGGDGDGKDSAPNSSKQEPLAPTADAGEGEGEGGAGPAAGPATTTTTTSAAAAAAPADAAGEAAAAAPAAPADEAALAAPADDATPAAAADEAAPAAPAAAADDHPQEPAPAPEAQQPVSDEKTAVHEKDDEVKTAPEPVAHMSAAPVAVQS